MKSGIEGVRARAFVVGRAGIYSRALNSEAELNHALEHETFQLVLQDVRDYPGDSFAFIEKARQRSDSLPLVLLSPELDLEKIVQAIRLGVKDIFNPPIDFTDLQERVVELLRTDRNGHLSEFTAARWFEIARFFTDIEGGSAPAQPPGFKASRRASNGTASPHVDAKVAKLRTENERLVAELERKQTALFEAECALVDLRARLEAQTAGSAGARESGEAELMGRAAELAQLSAKLAEREATVAEAEEALVNTLRERAAQQVALNDQTLALSKREAEVARREAAVEETATAAQAGIKAEQLLLSQQVSALKDERALFEAGRTAAAAEAAAFAGQVRAFEERRRLLQEKVTSLFDPRPNET